MATTDPTDVRNETDDHATEEQQVLEFTLGDETYCVDIGYVEEIVDFDDLTPVPNAPAHVEGVMDLRGRTTTIVDPKVVLGIDEEGSRSRVVVFDPETLGDQGAVGWIVDDTDRVADVAESDIDDTGVTDDMAAVRGVLRRDDEFVVVVDPEAVGD